jgi:L-iditol 2-dehydrogenase
MEVGTPVVCVGSGGFAEQAVLPLDRLFQLPPDVPFEHAALVEPLVACAAALAGAHLPLGGTVLITGAGPMGLLLLQLARRGGAVRVLVSEPDPDRRQLALHLGAEAAIDPTRGLVPEAIRDFTGGLGPDVAFETAGSVAPLVDCLDTARDNGTVVIVGVNASGSRLDLNLYKYHPRNLTLRWSWGAAGYGDFVRAVPAVMPWIARLELAALISHRFELTQLATAFEVARSRQGLKVLVDVRV